MNESTEIVQDWINNDEFLYNLSLEVNTWSEFLEVIGEETLTPCKSVSYGSNLVSENEMNTFLEEQE